MIVVVGSANMDLVARVPHLPVPGETVLAMAFARTPGGKGANQAVAAARAGSQVAFVGRLGQDDHGNALAESMASAGVLATYIARDPEAPTGTALITVDDKGENSIVVVPGANGRVSPEDVERAIGTLEESAVMLAQLEIPLETVAYALEAGRAAGVRTVLNPSPVLGLSPSILGLVDVLVANEAEVRALAGVGYPVEPASAARLLLNAGPSAVVVTLGARGAVVVTSKAEIDIDAFEVQVVDTTGAGDAFAGNLAHGLDLGMDLAGAARFAGAAAALSVQQPGAQQSMPTGAQTSAWLGEERP